ncbi:hypothetical protein ACFHW0_10100 [Micromonospora sp. LOL_025]|uniref:hypothetical protein n=1 Tax=Micromonospora sp. LOL_025 TaxID=3345413 RepID=UPI003A8628C9
MSSTATWATEHPATDGPAYFTILAVDVASFSKRRNVQQQVVREHLYRCVREALREAGVDWERCYHEDRGDGLFLLVPPQVSKLPLLARLPVLLGERVAEHNRGADIDERFHLRLAVHAGDVQADEHGYSGEPLIHAFRILDAQPARDVLRLSGGPVVLIASDDIYRAIVRHDYRDLPSNTFQPVRAPVKETRTTIWLHVPGLLPPFSGLSPDPETPGAAPRRLRRWWPLAAAVATVGLFLLIYLTLRAGHGVFSAGLGVPASELPVDEAGMAASAALATALAALVGLAMVAAMGVGYLLGSSARLAHAVGESAALAVVVLGVLVPVLAVTGGLRAQLGYAFALMALLAFHYPLANRRAPWQTYTAGYALGVATLALAAAAGVGASRILAAPAPAVGYTTVLAAAATLLCVRIARRRPATVLRWSPASVLDAVRQDLYAIARRSQPWWVAVAATAIVAVVAGLVVTSVSEWLNGREQAASVALRDGHVPSELRTGLLDQSVTPATVTLLEPSVDPLTLCGRAGALAVSVVAREGGATVVLARDLGADSAATVLRLPDRYYLVQRHPLADEVQQRGSWRRPAC